MTRFITIFILLSSFLLSAPFKILSIKQDKNTIVLTFNENITAKDFKQFSLKDTNHIRYVYDIQGILLGNANAFEFQNNVYFKIAQNSKDKVRLVIRTPKELKILLETSGKKATLKLPTHYKPLTKKNRPKASPQNTNPPLTNEQQQSEKSDIPKNNKVIVIDPG
ncbi:MAG: N-acetylmuramoyl-L-alanine amidase, partial [Helicobacter sp.]|nr:N-acetylmuramoyl-L-alanine amidase [Helicobacter sp.]